jgi:hypothetical protein
MNENPQNDREENLEAPAKLIAALKETSQLRVFVPSYVDDAAFQAARRHFEKPTKKRFGNFCRWMLWPALAAACVLMIAITRLLTASLHTRYAREDLNHDGRVDILDSFALARQLKNGAALSTAFDVNGDGVIDERDVALIAAQAVKLERGKHS